MSYAEIFCRTHYSFLRGASHPSELVERAAALGLRALAITDLDGVYGIPKAYAAAREHPSLKLIVGSELTVPKVGGIVLLARDRAGYGLLCRMITASRADKPKGEAGLEWESFLEFLETSAAAAGLIAIPREPFHDPLATEVIGSLKARLPGRVYLPVSRFLDGRDAERVERVQELSRRLGVPLVATNDVHYHVAERRRLQDALVAIRENCSLDEAGLNLFQNGERYLKSPAQMAALFKDLPEALENALRIAESCTFSPAELRYRYPSEWIPEGESSQTYLARLTWQGAAWRYGGEVPADVRRQLEHELKLVEELQFADYFLTIWEIVEFAKKKNILCQGRGSAANSAICYCLGITAVDPVRMNLLFERFLSAERGEPPDIDVDFEHERREEVIQHIYEKYGRHRAGMVSAIITYRTKSCVRDLAKALGTEPEQVESVPAFEPLMNELKGFPRHLSIHSGGFTLSADPIIETVPVEPARMEGRTIVQWDKEDLATIGLLKVDILALGMLTALHKTMDLVERERGRALMLATIPAEDPRTYEMIRRADTIGTFQIESRAQMSMLPRLLPRTFYDLVVQVAIVRPGPIVGQMVHPYLRRRRGLESPRSPDPRLEPILSRTLGVPLFQEQVMKIAIVMAGFTPGEADELRRAIGAWRSSGSIEKVGKRLREGLLASGLPQEFVDRIFEQIKGFAEYGFPESHAASFALIAYASAYLRCHYPAEFACALLNSQPMGFYSSHTLVEDAKRHGVRVLPVHPNVSEWDCTLEQGALRIGWRVVRGLGQGAVELLLAERRKQAFAGMADFVTRSGLTLPVLFHLAMGEAFHCFGLDQRQALWEILAVRSAGSVGYSDGAEQLDLFSTVGSVSVSVSKSESVQKSVNRTEPATFTDTVTDFLPLNAYQAIRADYRSYGLSTRGHPMGALRKMFPKRLPAITSAQIKRGPGGRQYRVAGLAIVRQRPPTAKGTVFATLEDESGFLDLILHADVFEKHEADFSESPFLEVWGKLQKDGEMASLIVSRVKPLEIIQREGLDEISVASRDFR